MGPQRLRSYSQCRPLKCKDYTEAPPERQVAAITMPFLMVLIFWLAILFACFSLFADNNATTVVALCIFAFSASAAIFLNLSRARSAVHGLHEYFQRAVTQRAYAPRRLTRGNRPNLRCRFRPRMVSL